ncbi:MAG: glycosyltransferase [Flavobacterium sp.]
MKKEVYQIIENISFESGGLRTMVSSLDNYINETTDLKSSIFTLNKEKEDNYTSFKTDNPKSWCYSKEFNNFLKSDTRVNNLFHLHGVWMYPQYLASQIAKQKDIPCVITSHGMLEPYLLNDKKFKKSMYYKLFLKSILKEADCLHAITPGEKDNLYKLSNNKNIVEIPNLIHYKSIPQNTEYYPQEEYILYLGRFHKVKGIELLIAAFQKIKNKTIKLYLVGFKNDYSESLAALVKKNGLENRVKFIGEIVGSEKYTLFSNAKVFVAPSYSEVIGMVNLEAAICKTPVITTLNTGLNPDWGKNGGLIINPVIDELIIALNQATEWSFEERIQRGNELSNYVINNYSWEKKGYLWTELYDSL